MAFNKTGALTISLIVIFLLIVAGGIVYIALQDSDVEDSGEKLQVCPDAWYNNQMPGEDTGEERQYFIIDGERKELEHYDLAWIREHCAISEPQDVY